MAEITPERREALIEEYRDINVDHEWWDDVYESFKADMADVGIKVVDMAFSGFWSQGDGAQFTGLISNHARYFEAHPLTAHPALNLLVALGGTIDADVQSSGRYPHEYSTVFSIDAESFRYLHLANDPDLQEALEEMWDAKVDAEFSGFEDDLTSTWRGYMRDLYRRLGEEYDYLTSDDAVWDTIVANELDTVEDDDAA